MISATSPDLAHAVRNLRWVDKDVRRAVADESTPRIAALWSRGVSSHTRSTVDRLVFGDPKVGRGNPPVLRVGNSGRRLSGGAPLHELARPQEFGGYHNRRKRYTGRNRHGQFQATRRTQEQLPRVTPTGRVAYPAVAGVAPAAVAIWCDIITRRVAEACMGEQVQV